MPPVPTSQLNNAVLLWLLRRRNPVAVPDAHTGEIPLGYGWPLRAVALAVLAIFGAFLGFSLVVFRDDFRGLLGTSLIFGLGTLGGLWAVYESFGVKMWVTPEGLGRGVGPVGAGEVRWSDVTKIGYFEPGNWIYFRSRTGPTLRVSVYRNGLLTLAEQAREGLAAAGVELSADLLFRLASNP